MTSEEQKFHQALRAFTQSQPPAIRSRQDAPAVRCLHCEGSIPGEAFVYWAMARRAVLLFASCPTCSERAILPEAEYAV